MSYESVYLLLGIVLLRILNAFVVETSFVPDELFQSLEVASRLVFGTGYLTWEWHEGLRSYLHVLPFAGLFKVLALFVNGCDDDDPINDSACHVSSFMLMLAPKILQGLFTSVGDFSFYLFARRVAGAQIARWTLALHLSNWFHFFTAVRTLSNTMEFTLLMVSCYYFACHGGSSLFTRRVSVFNIIGFISGKPRMEEKTYCSNSHHQRDKARQRAKVDTCLSRSTDRTSDFMVAVGLATLSFVIRPTSCVFLGCMALLVLNNHNTNNNDTSSSSRSRFLSLFFYALMSSGCVLCVAVAIDCYFYGRLVFPMWQFLSFNVFQGASALFGTHPWHWYIFQGVPAVTLTSLPIIAAGIIFAARFRHADGLLLLGIANIFILSFIAHKEFRFLSSTLPFCHLLAAMFVCTFLTTRTRRKLLLFLILSHSLMAIVTCRYHQRGTHDVILYLDTRLSARHSLDSSVSPHPHSSGVLFLLPCYSAGLYSVLQHRKVSLWFLRCPPFLNHGGSDSPDVQMPGLEKNVAPFHRHSEQQQFFREPERWLFLNLDLANGRKGSLAAEFDSFSQNRSIEKMEAQEEEKEEEDALFLFPHNISAINGDPLLAFNRRPQFIVLFGRMADRLSSLLNSAFGYRHAAGFFHTWFPFEEGMSQTIHVFESVN